MRDAYARALVSAIFCLSWSAAPACENALTAPCIDESDCTVGEQCLDGVCEAAEGCVTDLDCSDGSFCSGGACVIGLPPGGTPDAGAGPGGLGPGVARVSPSAPVDFGSPILGVGVERTISLLNVGTGPLTLNGVERAQETSDEFTWSTSTSLPVSLEVGDRIEVTLIYTLADGTDDLGTLYLLTDAGACDPACADPRRIPVSLLSEFKGGRNLQVAPEEHDFGYIPPNAQSSPRALLLTNDGTLDKVLTVSSLSASGDTSQFDFTLPATPLYLSPGQSLEVPVVYAPTVFAMGHTIVFSATANSDAPEYVDGRATFLGTSQPPNALIFDPPELVFSDLAVGQTEQRISVLRNVGGTAIRLDGLQLGTGSSEYTVFAAQSLPYTIAPSSSVAVYVDYNSQSGQAATNTVRALNDQSSGDVPVLSLRGQGFVPPGGPNLEVTMEPEPNEVTQNCACDATGDVPAANIDLSYRAPSGASCAKPQNVSCALSGGDCDCPSLDSYGDVVWGASRIETVRGETWIVGERVRHEGGGGQDGTFTIRADLLDDCLAVPGSTNRQVNWTCGVYIDCDGGNQACVDYGVQYPDCESQWDYWSYSITSQDCLRRGPIQVRTRVRIYGGATDQAREFCTTLGASGQGTNVVNVVRQSGYFTFGAVTSGVVEVSPGQPCPS